MTATATKTEKTSFTLPTLLTINETAEALRLSRGGVNNLIESGILPATRIGKSTIRIKASDLEALIEGGRLEV